MNHAQLRAFHAVASEGGFTAAANRLNLTQPAVTLQVKALEEAYGVDLFHRRGRRVELTDTGAALYAQTLRLFRLEEETDDLLSSVGGLRQGRLRVGADGPYHVIGAIAAFRAAYPGIRLSVSIGNSAVVRQSLLDYRTDVAVLAEDDGDDRFLSLPYGRHRVVAFVNTDHPWAGRKSVRLADMEGQAMIRRESGSATRRAFEAALANAGVAPDFVLDIGSREAVREAVAAGLGFSVVAAPEIGYDPRLVALEIKGARVETREYVVCLRERAETRAVSAFLATARTLAKEKQTD
jgi:aminoethylphosphonate catabolism LysR family transcriptional regulator